ncbi:MAG TPA: hypothetical protein VH913_08870 [Hyphomicrobiaceae bacterium]|jgi:hypothetical protein
MAILAYQAVRTVKWLLWAGFVAYCLHFLQDRTPHLDQFGHLTLSTETVLFGVPLVAMAMGLFQMYLWDLAYGETAKARLR